MQTKETKIIHEKLAALVDELKFLYDTKNVIIMVGVEINEKQRCIARTEGTIGFLNAGIKQINMVIDSPETDA
jgi:hypothetical protein